MKLTIFFRLRIRGLDSHLPCTAGTRTQNGYADWELKYPEKFLYKVQVYANTNKNGYTDWELRPQKTCK